MARLLRPEPGRAPSSPKYHHFSLVVNRRRRFAFFTAVNIDGRTAKFSPPREGLVVLRPEDRRRGPGRRSHSTTTTRSTVDTWVRRLDPAWGRTASIAKVANDDTFHFSNCSPQHERFNQGKNLSGRARGLPPGPCRRLAEAADGLHRLGVPRRGPEYPGVKIPRRYWKVAAVVRPEPRAGGPRVRGGSNAPAGPHPGPRRPRPGSPRPSRSGWRTSKR